MTTSKLFQPIKVGDLNLEHRVVLAPLTRFRATAEHVHTDLGVELYRQRSSTPGTLLISEASFIAPKAGGYPHVPLIQTDDQISAWKKVCFNCHSLKANSLTTILRSPMPFMSRNPSSSLNFGLWDELLILTSSRAKDSTL